MKQVTERLPIANLDPVLYSRGVRFESEGMECLDMDQNWFSQFTVFITVFMHAVGGRSAPYNTLRNFHEDSDSSEAITSSYQMSKPHAAPFISCRLRCTLITHWPEAEALCQRKVFLVIRNYGHVRYFSVLPTSRPATAEHQATSAEIRKHFTSHCKTGLSPSCLQSDTICHVEK
jgi:hypothetical protein